MTVPRIRVDSAAGDAVAGAPAEQLTNLERQILEDVRGLLRNRKHCMLVVRVDGLAVQVYDATPRKRIPLDS